MRGLRSTILLLALAGGSAAACTLTTSLDGFANGDPPGAQLPDGAPEEAGRDAGEAGAVPEAGGASAYRALVLSDTPVAYYRLGDLDGIAKDEVGAHDGKYTGKVGRVAGAIAGDPDKAAVFDGTSYVDVGNAFAFDGNRTFTLESWVSPMVGATDPMCIAARSLAPGGVSGNISEGWSLYVDAVGLGIEFLRVKNSVRESASSSSKLTAGRYAHVVAVYDGTTVAVWMDGAQVGSGGSGQALAAPDVPLTLGAGRGGIYCYFLGALDELAIYDKPLSAARIRAHAAAGSGK